MNLVQISREAKPEAYIGLPFHHVHVNVHVPMKIWSLKYRSLILQYVLLSLLIAINQHYFPPPGFLMFKGLLVPPHHNLVD